MSCVIWTITGFVAGVAVGLILCVEMISRMRRNWRREKCSRFSVER